MPSENITPEGDEMRAIKNSESNKEKEIGKSDAKSCWLGELNRLAPL
jgi:hypothetical protein